VDPHEFSFRLFRGYEGVALYAGRHWGGREGIAETKKKKKKKKKAAPSPRRGKIRNKSPRLFNFAKWRTSFVQARLKIGHTPPLTADLISMGQGVVKRKRYPEETETCAIWETPHGCSTLLRSMTCGRHFRRAEFFTSATRKTALVYAN